MKSMQSFKFLFIVLAAFIAVFAGTMPGNAAPGDITTIAGDGVLGYYGDGGPATFASFNSPYDVAIDSVGNVYIADNNNHVVRKVATNGIITTFAGNGAFGFSGDNGPATSAQLYYPRGVAVDSIGNVYIAEYGNQRIRKVATDGVITTVAGNGVAGFSGDNGPATSAKLYYPSGVAVDSVGNIYIADMFNYRIRKVATDGVITTVAGSGSGAFAGDGGPAVSAKLNQPLGVEVDSIGNIYIADTGFHRIRKVGTDGIITTFAGTGMTTFSGDGGPATSATLYSPDDVAVDSIGNVYIADRVHNRIRKVGTDGIITTVAGNGLSTFSGDNGPATSASVYNPMGVVIDPVGNMYIADQAHQRIRKVEDSEALLNVSKTGAGTGAVTSAPVGIDCGADCNEVYIRGTAVILTPTPDAGSAFAGWSGDADCSDGLVTIDADMTCTAQFDVIIYTVTPSAGANGGISPSTPQTVIYGATPSFTVTPNSGYGIASVTGCGGTLGGNTYTTGAITADCAVTATFAVLPDFTVTSVTAPASAQAGTSQAVSATIANTGTVAAAFTYMRFYISADANITTADTKLTATSLVVSGLAAGASQTINANVTIPSLAPGTYYIGAIADVTGKVAEMSEGNNTASIAITVTSGIDLTVSAVTAPVSAQAGTSQPISATIANTGIASSPFTYMRLYISPDAVISTADTKLTATSLVVNGLAAGASQIVNANLTIPGVAPGIYYIGAIADVTNRVAELNEGNNTASIAITVTSGVDLAVTSLTASSVITTFAGTGTQGFSGDNGPAASAKLFFPFGVAVDSIGNVYIADMGNSVIRKVATNGVITTVAGTGVAGFSGDNGQATSAMLNSPLGVAVDSVGNIYIADTSNHRIRKVGTDGIITTVAGIGTAAYSGDNGPATSASLWSPASVAIDSIGNVYIADYSNHRIRKVGTDGVITTFAGDGTAGFSGDNGQATSAMLNSPYGVAVDSTGNIYISDRLNRRIRKVATDGVITTVAGNGVSGYSGDNGPATSAMLVSPRGVAIDSIGNLYIADNNHRIRKVATDGVITTFAGNGTAAYSGDNGPATSASLNFPSGVAVDSSGNVYIADYSNHRIRKVTPGIQAVSATITNSGTVTSAFTYTRLYISPDANITTTDTKLTATSLVVNGLGAGASQVINANVTIPSLAPGTYYVGAIADVTNKVVEYDEGNNANSTAITITP